MAPKVQSPEKELRFTRSGQAAVFWLVAAMLAAAAVTMVATALYRDVNPHLPHPAWALVPFAAAAALARQAIRLTRHAYIILTPLGIEVFPFFRPTHGLQIILWQEIDHAAVNSTTTRLTLHRDRGETSGVHLSLRPIRTDRRDFLVQAILGRVSAR